MLCQFIENNIICLPLNWTLRREEIIAYSMLCQFIENKPESVTKWYVYLPLKFCLHWTTHSEVVRGSELL